MLCNSSIGLSIGWRDWCRSSGSAWKLRSPAMYVYPLSTAEDRTVRWAGRIVPAVSAVVILFLGVISVASAAG